MVNKDLLRFYREDNDLTYEDLSKHLRCPKKIIELWEAGELIPREEDVKKLAKLYNISPKDLYSLDYSKSDMVMSIILVILGVASGFIIKNYGVGIMAAISFVVLFRLIILLDEYSREASVPKSLFGYNLLEGDMALYLIESNIIASAYTIVNIILRLFRVDFLIFNIDILESKDMNTLLIMIISYVALMVLIFIVELIFGKILLKEYRDVK